MFNYVLPVYFFKIGVRCNDEDLTDTARFKSEDLFYAFKHTFYSDVSYSDLRNRVVYRPSVWEYWNKHMYSTAKVPRKSQGADFILDVKVKC